MKTIAKQKAIFFVNSHAGGAEKMTLFIASCLDKEKYDVVYYIVGKEEGLIRKFIPADAACHLLYIKSFKDGLVFKLIKTMRKEKPDFVFSSLIPINIRLCFASLLFPKVRVIIRSNNYLYTQSLIQKTRIYLAYRFIDHLITQTDEMRDEHIKVLKLKPSQVTTLSNPINTEEIIRKTKDITSPFGNDVTNYVYVGRIHHVKGLDVLMIAFAKLLTESPDSLLYLVGETGGIFKDFYEELVTSANSLGIADKVKFVGFSDNPYQYMKYADCMVLPSRNEGLPNVVIEALYLGTPVAATNCIPVIKRIIREKVDGFVTEVDDADGLARAMQSAAKLGRVQSAYRSATREDFQQLFIK